MTRPSSPLGRVPAALWFVVTRPAGAGHWLAGTMDQTPGRLGRHFLLFFAFSSSAAFRVLSGSSSAVDLQPLQQMNTGCPLTMTFIGVPMLPSLLFVMTAQ